MTDKLPPNLLTLFTARPALRYLPPSDYAPEDRVTSKISGVAQFVGQMKDYEEIPYEPTESWLQRKERIKAEKRARVESLRSEVDENFAPIKDPNVKGDAMKTLFIARLSYETKETDLEREFGRFGPIERIRIVADTDPGEGESKKSKKKVKPNRGYAFIVYEREKDMKAAYKETDGIRIKDRRVLVDVERGRVVVGWRPRRLGGGLGGRGYTKTTPARPIGAGFGAPPPGGPGGFRGAFRGGFDRGGFRGGFRGGDRGGYGGGRGGGLGYQGGGGFGGGGRGGFPGGASGGYGGVPPPNAPSGPGGGPRPTYGPPGGFGGPQNGSLNGGPGPIGSEGGQGGYDPRRNGGYEDRGGTIRGGAQGGSRGYGPPDGARNSGFTGGNREPVRVKDERGSYIDDRRDRGYVARPREDEYPRKRHHEADAYEDPRAKRRY